jgi:hypothetical protein
LIRKNTLCCRYGVFKVRANTTSAHRRKNRLFAGRSRRSSVSQNSTACDLQTSRSTFVLGEPSHRTRPREATSTSWAPTGVSAPVSLERR